MHWNSRIIKLYSTPKIDYIDPQTHKIKGTIFLESENSAKVVDNSTFDLITKHRTFTFFFKDNNNSANFWVNTINQTIKTSLALKK